MINDFSTANHAPIDISFLAQESYSDIANVMTNPDILGKLLLLWNNNEALFVTSDYLDESDQKDNTRTTAFKFNLKNEEHIKALEEFEEICGFDNLADSRFRIVRFTMALNMITTYFETHFA